MSSKESEKKIIADKVAKVREVVDNATTNDIIMVLHTFDLDVNKTIQSFCEDGAASILGDWVTSGNQSAAVAKKKKNKKKGGNAAAAATSEPASSAAAPAQPQKAQASSVAAAEKSNPVTKPAPAASATTTKAPATNGPSSNDAPELTAAFKAIRAAVTEREKELKQLLSSNPKASISFDSTFLLKAISTFGATGASAAPKPVQNGKPASQPAKAVPQTVSPPPAGPIKHATSQSSLTSSVGADSGVNLSPTHKEEKKPAPAKAATVVKTGGFQMSSDGLSADQLAALQQTLQLQLAARGLDTSVLTSSENTARRPRNNNKNEKKGGQGKAQQAPQPKLSIL